MIMRRHWIPLAFAFACFLGMGWTCGGQGQIKNEWVELLPGESQKLGPFSLEEKARYVLELKMQGKPKHGFLADIELAVQREGDEEPLFELEDGYWAESGIWREGGESGTWYEKNGATKLYFAAPAAGEYNFTVKQNNNANGAKLNIRFTLSKKPYSAGAFLFGFFVFMVISLIVFLSRGRLFKKLLGQMGKGTVLKWDNKIWEVQDVLFFGDAGRDRPYANTPGAYSISYHLKSNEDEDRYLSIETYDYEYEDSEGDDYDASFDAILISEPLTEAEQEQLSAVGKSTVSLRGKQFREDRDYSGVSEVYTEKDGMVFKSRVVEKVFMNSERPENWRGKGNARSTAGIPDDDGDLVLSLTKYDDNDTEWELSRAINWQNLKVKRMVSRKEIDFSAGSAA